MFFWVINEHTEEDQIQKRNTISTYPVQVLDKHRENRDLCNHQHMTFDKNNLGRCSDGSTKRLGDEMLERSPAEGDLRVPEGEQVEHESVV